MSLTMRDNRPLAIEQVRDRLKSLAALSREELSDLHFDWEIACAFAIKKSARGSREREELTAVAYEGITRILREMRARDGRDVDAPMGFSPAQVDEICRMVGAAPRAVLDIGCSTGVLVRALVARGYDARGIDVSAELVERARALDSGEHGASTRFVAGNFLNHDFGDLKFDLIHTNDVLEHIHPDEAAEFLSKCRRLLRAGGILWLVTPNKLIGPGDATSLRFPWGTPAIGLHLKEYTLRELTRMLRRAHFTQVQSRLFGAGRGRRATKARMAYAKIKCAAEPLLATVPGVLRRRLMGILDYSFVVGRA